MDRAGVVVMRRSGTDVAFAFDRDFVRQGFRTIPWAGPGHRERTLGPDACPTPPAASGSPEAAVAGRGE